MGHQYLGRFPISSRVRRVFIGRNFLWRNFLWQSLIGCSLLALCISAGCSDIVTFSKESHEDGMKLYQDKDYADAAGAFRSATKQVPNDYVDYYWLANCDEQQALYPEAIEAYQVCYQIMKADPAGKQDDKLRGEVLDGWATAVAKSDSRDSQINSLEARAHEQQTADDYLLLAKIYVLRGDADSAIDSFNRAEMIEPQNFAVAKEYGLYLERIGQNQKAASPLRQAYALNSSDPQVSAALRRIGIVPGPSIGDESALAKPLIPQGTIPAVDPGNAIPGGDSATPASSQQPPAD